MTCYSIEPGTRKYVKGSGFLSFARKVCKQYGKKLLSTATKRRLDAPKTASKKVVHKTAEATVKLIGNKFAEKIVKPKPAIDKNSRNVEEMNILSEQRKEMLNKFR